MGFEAWIVIAVLGLLLAAMATDRVPPDLLFLGATVFLALLGIITPSEAFAGFSNSGMLTVAMLFVVAAALRDTGMLDAIGHQILGRARTFHAASGRLALAVVPMSAFLNNTPIVAMFMPIVMDWCRKHQIAPSRLLIPLSYLTILGGTCTLIGTSTNLVVQGMMVGAGLQPMRLFEIGAVGLPYAVVGIAYLLLFGNRLLPERKELLEQLGESRREYMTEMEVRPGCRLAGQSLAGGGLRSLPGLFVTGIFRRQEFIAPVGPETIIEAEDRLVFTGVVASIIDLEKISGLVPVADPEFDSSPDRQRQSRLCEAVISESSPLVGKTIRDAEFRATYGAAVLAVHRAGRRLQGKIGDVVLQPGDTLLMQVGPQFHRAHRNDPAFYLVSDVADWRPLRRDRWWIALTVFAGLLLLMASGWVDTLVAAGAAAVLMVATGCISPGEARRSVEWQVLVTIAAAFGIGQALVNSGAAASLAGGIVNLTGAWGPVAALAVLYLVGSLATEVVTNNAAAALLFPFCLELGKQYGVDPRPFVMALVLAASASFMTPIGYQTNMMVYGPGGYRFTDFLRIGAPLNLVLWIIAVVLIPLVWPFRPVP